MMSWGKKTQPKEKWISGSEGRSYGNTLSIVLPLNMSIETEPATLLFGMVTVAYSSSQAKGDIFHD